MNESENPFRKNELEFCDIIAEIGYENKDNLSWWASSIASKNFGISSLWDKLDNYLLDNKLFHRKNGLLKLILIFIKYLLRIYIIAPPKLRFKSNLIHETKRKVIIFSHCNENLWGKVKNYEDPYFKQLIEILENRGNDFLVIAHTYGDIFSAGRNAINGIESKRKVVPIELFLNIGDLFKAFYLTISGKLEIPKEVLFRNKNISPLLVSQYNEEKYNGDIFLNICLYFACRNILKSIETEKIIWPWENHSWENLMLIAQKECSEKTVTIGYQHSSLIGYLLNFFPGRKGLEYAPFPDKIITDGKITFDILKKYGHFPANCLEVGCALRYEYLQKYKRRSDAVGSRIGIIFSYRESSLKILSLLDKAACRLGENYKYILRFHPFIPYEKVVKGSGLEFQYRFTEFSTEPVKDFFEKIDILVYSDTTMCLEALKMGIPVIYIDTGKGFCGDVAFSNTDLKWIAADTEGLIKALDKIKNTDAEKIEEYREKAEKYVDEYFLPVTEERLNLFLK